MLEEGWAMTCEGRDDGCMVGGSVSSGSWGTMREARWRRSWCSGGEFMVAGKEAMLCLWP